MLRRFHSSRALLSWGILLLLMLAWSAWSHRYDWQAAEGWEPEQIGRNLSTGHGYTFRETQRWLFQRDDVPASARGYFPTAWQEPVNPLLIAGAFTIAGPYWGRFVVVACQTVFLWLTAILVYVIGRTYFGVWTGMAASIILLLEPDILRLALGTLTTATLAGLAVVVAAFTMLWCLDAVSVRRAVVLGVILGVAMLTVGATMLFIPLAVLLILVPARDRRQPVRHAAWKAAFAVPVSAAIVVSPWVVRNLLVFGELIPSRTGFGQIALTGNAILAETVVPGLRSCSATEPPPWTARNGVAAIQRAGADKASRQALEQRADACAARTAAPGYDRMNEAQRDKLYLRQAGLFAIAHPRVIAELLAAKALVFFYGGRQISMRFLPLLALLGVILARKRRAPMVLALLVLAYSVPYVLGAPYFPRYRTPVEPLLLLFAVYPLVVIASYCSTVEQRSADRLERAGAQPAAGMARSPDA